MEKARFEPDNRGLRSSTFMRGLDHRNLWSIGDATENLAPRTSIEAKFHQRGFLPEQDPLTAFPSTSEFAVLDEIGRDLPSVLHDRGFPQLCANPQDSAVAGESRLP
jgi:hypothetical protein